MISTDQACDYLITSTLGHDLSFLKLQHFLYYSQAWHLAIHRGRLFEGQFEAWNEGPVHRSVYRRFKSTKQLRSPMTLRDRDPAFDARLIPEGRRVLMDTVLEAYARQSDEQLQSVICDDVPWLKARGPGAGASCPRNLIDEDEMRDHHRQAIARATSRAP